MTYEGSQYTCVICMKLMRKVANPSFFLSGHKFDNLALLVIRCRRLSVLYPTSHVVPQKKNALPPQGEGYRGHDKAYLQASAENAAKSAQASKILIADRRFPPSLTVRPNFIMSLRPLSPPAVTYGEGRGGVWVSLCAIKE